MQDDVISRDAAIEAVKQAIYNHDSAIMRLTELPSVAPSRHKGHWIWEVTSHKCSACNIYTCFGDSKPLKFCPNCGAKMESEDKE